MWRKVIILALFLLSACQPATAPRAADAAREYELRGKVLAVDVAKKRVTIDHEAMPGYMEAMTMPFAIRDEEMLKILAAGDVVTGKLLVEKNVSWIVVQSVSKPSEPIPGATPFAQVKAGDEAPDVALINQDGKKINLRRYRGQIVLLTFIYTRCPLPDFCILMSENFGQVSKIIAEKPALKNKVHLLSISMDPEFDQPATLKTYGQNYMSRFTRTDFKLWEFATGEPDAIRNFATFWGLTYQKDGAQIVHSLRTAFIDPNGKVIQVFDDKWQPEEAVAVLEKTSSLNIKP